MRLLCTSDWHIHSWMPFSTLDEYARPSRLMDYLKLANIVRDLAIKQEVDAIILAGDISENSLQTPAVHDIIGDVIRILASSNIPVHIIAGQHDLASKTAQKDFAHSILTEICKDMESIGVYYYGKTELTEINGHSVLFHPWVQNHSLDILPNADIFVGHGVVKGCTNLDNYVFVNGFDKNELFEKYSLSIIGDIHKKHVHEGKDELSGRRIIQPGCPLQQTFKDDPDCGVYIADFDKSNDNIGTSFYSIHDDLAPDTFHRFVYDQESTDLIHSRPKIKIKKDDGLGKKVEIKRDNKVIYDSCLKLISEQEGIDQDQIKAYLEDIFKEVSLSSDKYIAQTKINKVFVRNFLSIDTFELDFNHFPKACVTVGRNGSGKSTLPEAIYWGITGNTTKSTNVSEIFNSFNKAEECAVNVHLNINGKDLIIKRSRKANSSSLAIVDDSGEHKRTSIRETQALIYSLLGLKDWQILMFSYFSAEKTSIFANMGDSNKNDLIGQIVGLDFIEAMREYCKDFRVKTTKEITKNDAVINEKQSNNARLSMKLSQLKEDLDENRPKLEAKITTLSNKVALNEEELYSVNKQLEDLLVEEDSNVREEYFKVQSKYESTKNSSILLEKNIEELKFKVKKATEGVCPTCNQDLHNKEMLIELKESLISNVTAHKKLPCLGDLEFQLRDLDSKIKENSSINKVKDQLSSSKYKLKNDLIKLESEINKLKSELEKESNFTLINHLEETIDENSKDQEDLIQINNKLTKELSSWKYLEGTLFKKNGDLIKELNKQGSVLIQRCIDEIIPNDGFKITIDRDLNIIGKFYNNTKVSYNLMSSGQKRITDITMMVALNNLFSKIYELENGVLGLCVYDEILSFLDDNYVTAAKYIVDQSIANKVLVITHDHNLMNMYDSRISVEMGSTGSMYTKSWE